MKRNKASAIFLADADPSYLELIMRDPGSRTNLIISAIGGMNAQSQLSVKNPNIRAIFISSNITDPSGQAVCKFARDHYPDVPIFLMKLNSMPIDSKTLQSYGITDCFTRPLKLSNLLDRITISPIEFDEASVAKYKTNGILRIFSKPVDDDKLYCPMKLRDFFPGQSVPFSVFVRLESGKYIKILQEGDDFSEERLKSYAAKGVVDLYILKTNADLYLNYLRNSAADAVTKKDISWEMTLQSVLSLGDRVGDLLRSVGISNENLNNAEEFFANILNVVNRIDFKSEESVQMFLEDIENVEHATGTSLIAGILMKSLKLDIENAAEVVGLAAMFHDIGLYSKGLYTKSNHLLSEEPALMTQDEAHIFNSHPNLGAEILRQILGINPIVLEAIAQHHERIDRSGFPGKFGPGQINLVSEIIGLSDEIYRSLKKSNISKTRRPFDEIYVKVKPLFSLQILEAYKKNFLTYASASQ